MTDPHSVVEPGLPAIASAPTVTSIVEHSAPASSLAMASSPPGVDSEASVETSPRAPDLSASGTTTAATPEIDTMINLSIPAPVPISIDRLNPHRHEWPIVRLRTPAVKGVKIYVRTPPDCREYEDQPEPTPNMSRVHSPTSTANSTGGFTSVRLPPA
ncbi:hypothetical protein H0H92_000566 [Tricholoma furcatifolium]|nr:hypothetical protein H0H92_000566 [Tricholoma furcatifolium]